MFVSEFEILWVLSFSFLECFNYQPSLKISLHTNIELYVKCFLLTPSV